MFSTLPLAPPWNGRYCRVHQRTWLEAAVRLGRVTQRAAGGTLRTAYYETCESHVVQQRQQEAERARLVQPECRFFQTGLSSLTTSLCHDSSDTSSDFEQKS
jgi:hypothetical protein